MYVCPICKKDMTDNWCPVCEYAVRITDNVPKFFTESTISKQYEYMGDVYDEIYGDKEDVWNTCAGRGPQFNKYIATLVKRYSPKRYLDLGCGQGYLLAEVDALEKYGTDISHKALLAARSKTDAELCQGFAEQLPYPSEYFDVISSIGVMTHLIDDLAGTREIHRVLCKNGKYLAGIYVPPSRYAIIITKFREFTYPRPKPYAFIQSIFNKLIRTFNQKPKVQFESCDQQPVRRYYTPTLLKNLFNCAGFTIEEVITKMRNPRTPLSGAHFRIYVLKKKTAK